MRIFDDNSLSIGNTPMVRLDRIGRGLGANLLGKVEGRNPSYSVKCRIGAAMIWDAEERGLLKPGGMIVEPTSGNTGIGLAFAAAARQYRLVITMPESFSGERVRILEAFGAEVIRTPVETWMTGAIERAEEIVAENPGCFMPQQFKNPANPGIHVKTTGPEIWRDTDGEIDVLVSGVGTGGTITGVSRFIKHDCGKAIESVAVEPATSAVLSGQPAGPHGIQGIGAGFIPDALDLSIIDRIMQVEDEEAFDYTRRLAREEGVICGMSSGAALAAAVRLAGEEAYHGKNIVIILPDSGERYLSTKMFDV